jgi:hypothetical protein
LGFEFESLWSKDLNYVENFLGIEPGPYLLTEESLDSHG